MDLMFQSFPCIDHGQILNKKKRKQNFHYHMACNNYYTCQHFLSTGINSIQQNRENGSEVVIIQPNTDPYTEKFTIPFEDQLKKVITLANTEISDKTEWVITPETTIDDPANLDDLANDKYVNMIKEMIKPYPDINVVTGLVTYRLYPASKRSPNCECKKN